MTIDAAPSPPPMLESAQLADAVHGVRVGDDLILLDLRADDYLLITDCGSVSVDGDRLHGPMDLLLELSAAELLGSGSAPRRRPAPSGPPSRGLPDGEAARPTPRDIATFASIWWDCARRKSTVETLGRRLAGRRGRRDDLAAIATRVAIFRQMLPLAPHVGACLFQAELLLRFLNAADLDADWVFGVRTWPFLAHCWLQIGDHSVSQNPETLTLYRPIMVV